MKRVSIMILAMLILLFVSSYTYALSWNWSFSNESGTFTTDGDSYGAGWYNVSDFSVISSSLGAPIGSWSGGQYEAIVQSFDTYPPYSFYWDGSSVTQWASAGSNSYNWLVFEDLAYHNWYFFGWQSIVDANGGVINLNTANQATYYVSGDNGNGRDSQPSYLLTVDPIASVPEPATMLLLGTGLVGLAGFRKKFKKA